VRWRSPQNVVRPGERVSILKSKPCRWPPRRGVRNTILARYWIVIHTACVKEPCRRPIYHKSRHVRYLRLVQFTDQRARPEEDEAPQRTAAIVEPHIRQPRRSALVPLTGDVADAGAIGRTRRPSS
jgi:hypothetical protein